MSTLNLSNRLMLCGSFVRSGKRVADIGTDHGYLPVWLVLNGKAPSAVAADINKGPLNHCIQTIEKYGVGGSVTTRLSDGLAAVGENEADDIVIAGMGGELIVSIIDSCCWSKSKDKHFILQPMTKPEVLRQYLYTNGFTIDTERAVLCEGKVYSVLSVVFTGSCLSPTLTQIYKGNIVRDENSVLYYQNEIKHLQNKVKGFTLGGNMEKAQQYNKVIENLRDLI